MNRRFLKKATAFLAWLILLLLLTACQTAWSEKTQKPSAPRTEQITLQIQQEVLLQITQFDQIRSILDLLGGSAALGYAPKTWFPGPSLVLTDSDGTLHSLELDLDSDLFRYDGLFYDYGPGNDNNALAHLLTLLGLDDWPEAVKSACSYYFDQLDSDSLPADRHTDPVHQEMLVDVWYPDWAYLQLLPEQADLLLEALKPESPVPVAESIPDVPDTVFTVHIAFDGGKEYDLAYMGQADYYLRDFQTNQVYRLSSESLRKTLESAIAKTKESLYQ